MERRIIHIDMDAFYASVEQRDRPDLQGRPVVVGGRPEGRGVVAAASYEARQFGVHSAMPAAQAIKLCPGAVFVRPRFDAYRAISQQIRAIFYDYTDLVEPLSLDEAYLDVTANKQGIPSATWVANAIRERIFQVTRLTASAGVAPNKFLAKIASDVNKPNGIFVITPERAERFVAQLPIGKFHGIGKATEKRMHGLGIFHGEDLRERAELELVRHFGKAGRFYYRIARGIDERPVTPHRLRKSVGVEETFSKDLRDVEAMRAELHALAEESSRRLRKADVAGKTIILKLRYADFETVTRGRTGDRYVDDVATLFATVDGLMQQTDAVQRRVRLLGITVTNLNNQQRAKPDGAVQLMLPLGDDFTF